MNETNDTNTPTRWTGLRVLSYSVLVLLSAGLSLVALITLGPSDVTSLQLQVGSVAPVDILAPFSITYESEVLTQQQRESAAQSIPPVYTTPNTRVAREQTDKLRAALTFISATRADSFASFEQKLADLSLLENNAITQETASQIVDLEEAQWQAVQQESILVLQQVMRGTIREGYLEDARRSIPALVSFSLPDEQAGIVSELVSIYVVPNSFYSEELTEQRRETARSAVTAVRRSFVTGETVVERGKVITAADLEALSQLGLLGGEDPTLNFLNALTILGVTLSVTILFLYRQTKILNNPRHVTYMVVIYLVFLYITRLIIPGNVILPYLFPVAGFGMLLATLFGPSVGIALSVPFSFLVTYNLPNAFEVTMYYILSTMFSVLILGRGQRITAYFWAGFGAAGMGAATILSFRLLDPFTDITGLTTLLGVAFVSGIISTALTVLLQFFLAQLLGMSTALQLLELSRPDRPLLRHLLLTAPGTYQHSLQVANLSEQAAEMIGADALLTRVGALYHDIGKTTHPQYFIENQVPGSPNIHSAISPEESAQVIIGHVLDGLELAKKYQLPERIVDFIAEHHGTSVTRYQYIMAVKAADGDEDQVDISEYRYPGPRPRSRETALVMLADGCEARARAERPKTEQEIRTLIKEIIETKMGEGQLDETAMTTQDLNQVVNSFSATLRGIYHPRIEYPKLEKKSKPVEKPEPIPEPVTEVLMEDESAPEDNR